MFSSLYSTRPNSTSLYFPSLYSSANIAFEFSIQFYFTYCCQSTVCLKQSCREMKKDSVLGVFISWVTLLFYFSLASFRLLTKKHTHWVRKEKEMRHCMGLKRYTMNCCANRNGSGWWMERRKKRGNKMNNLLTLFYHNQWQRVSLDGNENESESEEKPAKSIEMLTNYLCTAVCVKQIYHEIQILTVNFYYWYKSFSVTTLFWRLWSRCKGTEEHLNLFNKVLWLRWESPRSLFPWEWNYVDTFAHSLRREHSLSTSDFQISCHNNAKSRTVIWNKFIFICTISNRSVDWQQMYGIV